MGRLLGFGLRGALCSAVLFDMAPRSPVQTTDAGNFSYKLPASSCQVILFLLQPNLRLPVPLLQESMFQRKDPAPSRSGRSP